MSEKIDYSWIEDGVPVTFEIKGPYEGIYTGVIDGKIRDMGVPGSPALTVRLRDVSEDYTRLTHCMFAACIPLHCLKRRET